MAATEIDVILPGPHPDGGEKSEQDADPEGKHQRGSHQQQRGGEACQDQRQHRALVAEGVAEIERQDVLDIECQLDGHGLVETEPLAQRLDVLGRRAAGLACKHGRRVARRQLQQQEIQDDHAENDGDRLQQAPKHIAQQSRAAHRSPSSRFSLPSALRGLVERDLQASVLQVASASAPGTSILPSRDGRCAVSYSRHADAKLV